MRALKVVRQVVFASAQGSMAVSNASVALGMNVVGFCIGKSFLPNRVDLVLLTKF